MSEGGLQGSSARGGRTTPKPTPRLAAAGEAAASPDRCWAEESEKSEAEMRRSIEELRREVGERDEMLNSMARKSEFRQRRRWRQWL
ncbi:hypothetical protein HYC85_022448 [Camellia sinensis]|uniref:Uncharacterized protein n=1 Tax=Camellia sinensis TaxID=4442 RepID=A0A7J7GN22_CAMSI|nr:hypothetical protein HYC85_022448 [Camellia sinensis]